MKAVEVKWHIPSPCLDASRNVSLTRSSSIKGPDWPLRKTQERQFTTLYLFHTPTGNRGEERREEGQRRVQKGARGKKKGGGKKREEGKRGKDY